MTSPLRLERGFRGRGLLLAALLALPWLPVAALWLGETAGSGSPLGSAFWSGLRTSLLLACAVGLVAWAAGLTLGVGVALEETAASRVLLAWLSLPLLLPSFLPALGWSSLAAHSGPGATRALAGPGGGLLVLGASGTALVALAAYAATLRIPASLLDAARLADGEAGARREARRAAAAPGCLAAGMAAVLTLSDPGPALVFGYRAAGSEVLTTFSALFDFDLAFRQSAVLGLVALLCALALAFPASERLASQTLARTPPGRRRWRAHRAGSWVVPGLASAAIAGVGLPLLGLCWPVARLGFELGKTSEVVARTGLDTLGYALGAGSLATVWAFLVAAATGRSLRLRRLALGAGFVLWSLPAALPALGWVRLATAAPPGADLALRSGWTVVLALGLRVAPIAALVVLRGWASLPASWAEAAAVHGASTNAFLRRVWLPALAPSLAVSTTLCALVATADVGTVLLLHPPGHPSLPLALFTVMANAPEAQVASLGLAYVLLASLALILALTLASRRAR